MTCAELDKNIRWSKDSFSKILGRIGGLVSSGRLIELGEVTPEGPFLSVRYKCEECGAIWRLTHPDQGMKGGFVRE
jgi:hypothetical protein